MEKSTTKNHKRKAGGSYDEDDPIRELEMLKRRAKQESTEYVSQVILSKYDSKLSEIPKN